MEKAASLLSLEETPMQSHTLLVSLSLILLYVGSACSSDHGLDDPIRAIQNSQAFQDGKQPQHDRFADDGPSYPLAGASNKFEVRDFKVDEATGKIAFHAEVVYFEFDDATLTKAGMQQLESLASYMQEHKANNLSIEGHCDRRGSVEYNLALGQRRSDSVRKYLGKLNVPFTRLDSVSFGKEKPAVEGDSEEALARNRRVEFAFKTYNSKTATKD